MEVVSDLDGRRNAARPAVFTCVRVRVPHHGKEEEGEKKTREIADEAAKPKRRCTGWYYFIFFLVFPGLDRRKREGHGESRPRVLFTVRYGEGIISGVDEYSDTVHPLTFCRRMFIH
jgi:hypothetical protein